MKPNLRIASDETPDKGMRADVSLDHKYRARRTGASPVEYASAVEIYKRPLAKASIARYALAVVLVLGAIYLGAK